MNFKKEGESGSLHGREIQDKVIFEPNFMETGGQEEEEKEKGNQ